MSQDSPALQDRPDHVDAARAMFVALLAVAGVRVLAQAFAGEGPGKIPVWVFGLAQQAAFLLPPLAYARAAGLRPLESSGFVRLPLRKLGLVLLASLGTMWLLQGLNAAQPAIFRWLGWEEKVLAEKELLVRSLESSQEKGLLFSVLIYAVVSPLCEETLFRGLVFRGFMRRFGTMVPLLFTSLVFAAMHDTLIQFALMLALGMFFALLVRLTGSLWAGIVAHAANNGAVLILTRAFGMRLDSLDGPWFMYPLSALVLAGALLLLALDRDMIK